MAECDSKALSLQAKEKGNKAFSEKNFALAVKEYSTAIEYDPTNAVFYSNRSASYSGQAEYALALADAEQCVKLRPEWIKGHTRMGLALFYLDRFKEAANAYSEGLKVDPDNKECKEGVQRAANAELASQNSQNARGPNTSSKSEVREFTSKFAGSDVVVVQNAASAAYDCVVVLLHGYGANKENLSPLGTQILSSPLLAGKRVKFYFPDAPISMGGGSFAWYPLDMQQLFFRAMSVGPANVFKGQPRPNGMDAALQRVTALLAEVQAKDNVPMSKIVLSGFSQGSWMACDTALECKTAPGGLALFSSACVCEESWKSKLNSNQGFKSTKIVQTHGKQDPLLNFALGEQLRDMLTAGGCNVDFTPFDGQHTIPDEGVQQLHSMIVQLCK